MFLILSDWRKFNWRTSIFWSLLVLSTNLLSAKFVVRTGFNKLQKMRKIKRKRVKPKQNTSRISTQNFRFFMLFHVLRRIPCWAANYIAFVSIFSWVTHRFSLKSITFGESQQQRFSISGKIGKRIMKTLNSFEIRGQNEKPSDFFANASRRMSKE